MVWIHQGKATRFARRGKSCRISQGDSQGMGAGGARADRGHQSGRDRGARSMGQVSLGDEAMVGRVRDAARRLVSCHYAQHRSGHRPRLRRWIRAGEDSQGSGQTIGRAGGARLLLSHPDHPDGSGARAGPTQLRSDQDLDSITADTPFGGVLHRTFPSPGVPGAVWILLRILSCHNAGGRSEATGRRHATSPCRRGRGGVGAGCEGGSGYRGSSEHA
mmetsp:Transcript_17393/g.43032  ORF Transcript_17393/g.43032 Transcript_17393/m.43032 type:complete len:218 (+) Transcript_17393:860-1513(+)